MKVKYWKILILFILVSCNDFENRINDFDNYKKAIYRHFPEFDVANKDNYLQDCAKEEKDKISFPLIKAAYAKVYNNNIFTAPKILNKAALDTILLILNDSSSFIWGEIGTPYFDKHIIFFDKKDSCIGLTHVSYDGQTYSDPQPKKMKWGMLTENALSKLKTLLNY